MKQSIVVVTGDRTEVQANLDKLTKTVASKGDHIVSTSSGIAVTADRSERIVVTVVIEG